jgi:FMN phosphatase YigB (HAD superfamily)
MIQAAIFDLDGTIVDGRWRTEAGDARESNPSSEPKL